MTTIEYGAMRTALATALATITALDVHKEEPDALPKVPFAVMGNGEIAFNTDMGGGRDFSIKVFVAVAEQDAQNGFSELDNYLAGAGSKSIKAAAEAATIGNGYAVVTRAENIGHVVYRTQTFIGAEFLVKAVSGG